MANTITNKSRLREILPHLNLTGTVSRKTPLQLRRMYDRAKRNGAEGVKAGSSTYQFDNVECWLTHAETALAAVQASNSTHPLSTTPVSAAVAAVRDAERPTPASVAASIKVQSQKAKDLKRKLKNASPSADLGELDGPLAPGAKRRKLREDSKQITSESKDKEKPAKSKREKYIEPPNLKRTRLRGLAKLTIFRPTLHTDAKGFEDARKKLKADKKEFELKTAEAKEEAKIKAAEKKEAKEKGAIDQGRENTVAIVDALEAAKGAQDALAGGEGREGESDGQVQEESQEEPTAYERCTTYYSDSDNVFTDELKGEIKAMTESVPVLLYHVHSEYGSTGGPGRSTRGAATDEHMEPSASVDEKNLYDSIYDFQTRSELIHNFGQRILWVLAKADQFSSYTTSLVFAFVHALGRMMKGELGITISVIDTRLATRVLDGRPAEFYYVPELKRKLRVLDWQGWTMMPIGKLASPRYTHEYVAHGEIDVSACAFRKVPLEDFLCLGLYDFIPSIYHLDELEEMTKLYDRCRQYRYKEYHLFAGTSLGATALTSPSAPKAFDDDFLHQASNLARLFDPDAPTREDGTIDVEGDLDRCTMHLQIFLDLVGLTRRQKDDELFADHIKKYFTESDVQDIMHANMTCIPNNLPESMQTMDRFREACVALGVATPGPNEIALVDTDFTFAGVWQGNLSKIKAPKYNLKAKQKKRAELQAKEDVEESDDGANEDEDEAEGASVDEVLAVGDGAVAAGDFVVEEQAVA
ncbi:hypothetical protein LTR56_003952 [Elasticomyces elasticus]|nr:hypothetical protein LTR56_003952 [Elasticomyces elasticus]KAK3661060.1 hypothetical protein LTR22_007686 [Elasticomyces elasticus]KAK4921067.1 hypothetical protein LTR49_011437 [Elasticomyces elasticus]KAK5752970.1 hypothetical protein LTS12_016941 [Elasticomyces elasticus]